MLNSVLKALSTMLSSIITRGSKKKICRPVLYIRNCQRNYIFDFWLLWYNC